MISLWEHQKHLVKRAQTLEKNYNIGVLGDPPGSGKSYVILSLIAEEKKHKKTSNLLFLPPTIIGQWQKYIQNYKLTYKIMDYKDISDLLVSSNIIYEYDICIFTSSYYHYVSNSVFNAHRVIIDEVDSFIFFLKKKFECQHLWIISASYKLLFDQKEQIFMKKNELKRDQILISPKIITDLQQPEIFIYKCSDNFRELLKSILYQQQIESINALSFSGIINSDKKIDNSKDLLVYIVKDFILQKERLESQYKHSPDKKTETKIKIIDDKINNIKERLEQKTCIICFEDIKIKIILTCCNNVFCNFCIERINDCPICRKKISKDKTIVQDCENDHEVQPEEISGCEEEIQEIDASGLQAKEKKAHILDILKTIDSNTKMLICSDYTESFNFISDYLEKEMINFKELVNNEHLENTIEQYRNGHIKVLLINTSVFGAGLNLEMTTDILLIHKTKLEEQIIGRAQRPGRKSVLKIHKFVYE